MNAYSFLAKYYSLQENIMFDKLIRLDGAVVTFCDKDDNPYWNQTLLKSPIDMVTIKEIERKMSSLKRNTTLYFENSDEFLSFEDKIVGAGYKPTFEDSWMFHPGDGIDESLFKDVKKVKNPGQLKTFLEVFSSCYQKNDPQNAYGELGNYLNVVEDVWNKHSNFRRVEYFITYKDDEPVAVSSLISRNGIGYILNIGSERTVRGEGYGKIATLVCVEKSKKKGNSFHCLATEEGTYANEFFKRIGFTTEFTAVGYTRKRDLINK